MSGNSKQKDGVRVVPALLFVMTACSLALCWVVDDGHDWRGDFAMYVAQAQSLIDGTLLELYEANVVTMQLSETQLGPYLYPIGFPLLLTPVLWCFGINFYLLKAVCCAALVFAIPLLYRIMRLGLSSSYLAVLSLVPIVFYHETVIFGNSILSDLPFLFFCMLSLVVIEKQPTGAWRNVLLGALLYFTYAIRDVGIFLLPVLAMAQWHQIKNSLADYGRASRLLPYVVFATLFFTLRWLLPPGQENHFAMLGQSFNLDSVASGWLYYSQMLKGMVGTSNTFVLTGVLSSLLIGMLRTSANRPHLTVYIGLNAAILLFWPYKQGFRLLFPLVPVLILFFFSGMEWFCAMISPNKRLASTVATVLVAVFTYHNFSPVKEYAESETNLCFTPDHQRMYSYMKDHVPQDALVAHYYPRVLRLFTGINAARIDQYAFDLGSEATYFQNSRSFTDESVIAKHELVFESGDEILLHKRP